MPIDKSIIITFISFQVKASDDCEDSSLQIFDGEHTNGTEVGGKLCGTSLPEDFESHGRSVIMIFTSNIANNTDKFTISYEITGNNLCLLDFPFKLTLP